MAQIDFLADHPELVHTLAQWFRAEWTDYYAGMTNEDVARELSEDLNRDRIPIRLVAIVNGELAGCIVLREQALSSQPNYSPGLGGLYVHPQYRRRGIGAELVRAGMNLALDLGYPVVYATTNAAKGILEGLHWQRVSTITHQGEEIGLYRVVLGEKKANIYE
jgi:RimJ/RimL family protein N-acetyltransferase